MPTCNHSLTCSDIWFDDWRPQENKVRLNVRTRHAPTRAGLVQRPSDSVPLFELLHNENIESGSTAVTAEVSYTGDTAVAEVMNSNKIFTITQQQTPGLVATCSERARSSSSL